jgi:hypothetical protein
MEPADWQNAGLVSKIIAEQKMAACDIRRMYRPLEVRHSNLWLADKITEFLLS